MSRVRHGASVQQLRAAAYLDAPNSDIAAAAEAAGSFARAARHYSEPGALSELDEADVDPLYAVPSVAEGLEAVGEIVKARAEAAEKINTATASALSSFDLADAARPRIIAATEALFDAVGAVNKATGGEVLAVVLPRTEAAAMAVAVGPSQENLRDPFLEVLGEPDEDPPVLHLNSTNFGAWLAFGDEAARGEALDALLEVRHQAAALKTAAGSLRKPMRKIRHVGEVAETMPSARELLDAWLALGEAITVEANRQLAALDSDGPVEA